MEYKNISRTNLKNRPDRTKRKVCVCVSYQASGNTVVKLELQLPWCFVDYHPGFAFVDPGGDTNV